MLAQPSLLLTLVAEELWNCEPLDRFLIGAFRSRHHPRQSRRHFRAQRHRALALVCEIVKLPDNFIAALRGEKFQRLQRWSVIFAESISTRDFAPLAKDVI